MSNVGKTTPETIKINPLEITYSLEDEKTSSVAKEKFAQHLEIVYKKIRGVVSAVLSPSKTALKTFIYAKTSFNLLSARFSAWRNNASPLSSNLPSNMEQALPQKKNKNAVTTTENKEEPVTPFPDIESLLCKELPDFEKFFFAYGTSDDKILEAAKNYPKAFEKVKQEDITFVVEKFNNPQDKIAFAVNLYRIAYRLPQFSKSWLNMSKLKLTLLNPQSTYLTTEEKTKVLAQVVTLPQKPNVTK